MKKQMGFTLIEALILVFILAIFTAIFVPKLIDYIKEKKGQSEPSTTITEYNYKIEVLVPGQVFKINAQDTRQNRLESLYAGLKEFMAKNNAPIISLTSINDNYGTHSLIVVVKPQ